jgi:nickel-dependent lactate racemase
MPWIVERDQEISWDRLQSLMEQTVAEARRRICAKPKRVLLLPPDITRMHSGAGRLTEMLYKLFADEADVHVIPTLGQHVPHSPEENRQMFGSIPNERIHAHDWRGGCVDVGEVPARFVDEATQGAADWAMPIVLNRMLMEEPWDLIINVGHVVPHEVLGFANHNKNYFIGLGGKDLICAAHMAAAACGIENNLGNLITPVRACFNRAEDEYLGKLPDLYVQVVLARNDRDQLVHTGVYVGAQPGSRAKRTSRFLMSRFRKSCA